MTEDEEKIAFKQWVKEYGRRFGIMCKEVLWIMYRSMDEEYRKKFLDKTRRNE